MILWHVLVARRGYLKQPTISILNRNIAESGDMHFNPCIRVAKGVRRITLCKFSHKIPSTHCVLTETILPHRLAECCPDFIILWHLINPAPTCNQKTVYKNSTISSWYGQVCLENPGQIAVWRLYYYHFYQKLQVSRDFSPNLRNRFHIRLSLWLKKHVP